MIRQIGVKWYDTKSEEYLDLIDEYDNDKIFDNDDNDDYDDYDDVED